tara:strand:+ start:5220 stop:5450 length:231 start_codon:yes stop_codon:yes gene_type:complete
MATPAKGKARVKTVKNSKTGRTRKVSYGQKGATIGKQGSARQRAYCKRSAGQMKKFPKSARDPNSPLRLSRKRWKC